MKIVFILLEVFLFFSCNHRQSTELLKIKPIDELLTEIPVSEFADSVSLIQLDNRFLLASYGNPCFTDSFFLVTVADGVLKYSYTGELLMKIGEIGQGPMEYNRNNLMTIDIRNKRIRVYSIQEKVMIEYSYDGDFLNRAHFDLPDDTFGYPTTMRVLANKCYFFYTSMSGLSDPYYWVITDTCGQSLEIKQKHGQPVLKRGYACGTYCTSSSDNSLLYYNLFNDTIFRFTEQGVMPAFLWEQGKHRISVSTEDISNDMMVFTMFAETKRFLFFKWIDAGFKSFSSFGFYDKKMQISMGTKKLRDDLNAQITIPLNWVFSYSQKDKKDYMIGKIEPYELPEEILQRENIDPEGNLVMIMIRLKDE